MRDRNDACITQHVRGMCVRMCVCVCVWFVDKPVSNKILIAPACADMCVCMWTCAIHHMHFVIMISYRFYIIGKPATRAPANHHQQQQHQRSFESRNCALGRTGANLCLCVPRRWLKPTTDSDYDFNLVLDSGRSDSACMIALTSSTGDILLV